jgi:hypothetical protein
LIPTEFIQLRQAKEAAASGTKPGDKEKEKPANQAISKASAVEMAIDYIKALKKTLEDTQSKLADAEAKLAGVNLNDTPTNSSPIPAVAENTTPTTSTANGTTTNGTGPDSSNKSPS